MDHRSQGVRSRTMSEPLTPMRHKCGEPPPGNDVDFDDILRGMGSMQSQQSYNGMPDGTEVNQFDFGTFGRSHVGVNQPEQYDTWSTVTDDMFNLPQPDWSAFQRQVSNPEHLADVTNLANFEDVASILSQADSNSDNGSQQNLLGSLGSLDGLGLDFSDASRDGHALYASALNQWTSHSAVGTYNPFGNPVGGAVHVPNGDVKHTQVRSSKSTPNASSKLSYSEVAKNKNQLTATTKSKSSSHVNKEKTTAASKTSQPFPKNNIPKKFKPRPVYLPRGGAGAVDDNIKHPVKPNSKYGLDDFAIPDGCKDGSLPTSRKGSTSSATSSVSGIEEIHLSQAHLSGNKSKSVEPEVVPDVDRKESGEPNPKKEPFFDPRRIFGSMSANNVPNNRLSSAKSSRGEDIILNNECHTSTSTQTITRPSSTYINNDLSDRSTERKKSNTKSNTQNTTHTSTSYANGPCEMTDLPDDLSTSSSGSSSYQRGQHTSKQNSFKKLDKKTKKTPKRSDTTFGDNIYWFLALCYEWMAWGLKRIMILLLMGLLIVMRLTIMILSTAYRLCASFFVWSWNYITKKCYTRWKGPSGSSFYDSWNSTNTGNSRRIYGLEENIQLPVTGEEAMKRLLSCKGKDPYSILGLRADASDEDIKKYYKKQAILVHPDKNHQPGAEEAFKILGHSFELIGEPEKRAIYNAQHVEAQQTEKAMKDFVELLNKLRQKMEEAANMMRCESCGGKHRRYLVDRPWYSSRFCSRCQTMHSAKEGDVWAESKYMGFLWNYYALMDGSVYNITEWASHQTEYFKHIQANAHHIFYRIGTNSTRQNKTTGTSNEEELNDFINHLFSHPKQPGNTGPGKGYGSTNSAGQGVNKKGRRRRGKKH